MADRILDGPGRLLFSGRVAPSLVFLEPNAMSMYAAPYRALMLCLVVLFLAGTPARAQRLAGESTGMSLGVDNPLAQLRQRLASTATVPLPLEGAVDAEEYIVGPGDLFDVSIGGAEPVLVTLPVTADGRLVLPDAGSIPMAGLTLAEARARAVEALRRQFQRVQVDVALAQPRQFYVHVSGTVPVPGRHLATPVARVSSVLEMAFADSTQPALTNDKLRPSLRNVMLTRRDGTRRSLDLLRYFATGDTEHNPYLSDGDVVTVPPYDPVRESVYIDGAVAFPGGYAYRPGDTVQDLVALAVGDQVSPVTQQVRLIRQQPGEAAQTIVIDADRLASGEAVPLQPLDHVFVVSDETLRGTATVTGWVHYPGTYPIAPGQTTLQELIELAGGLRPDALVRGAYLERRTLPEREIVPAAKPTRLDPSLLRTVTLPADTAAILQNMRLAGFDYMSRAYFAQELRLQNRVSVDLTRVTAGQGEPVYVQDGDRLVVPRDQQTVYVFGQVSRPGFINYAPGRDASYYIAAAGGASPMAGDAFVIETGTGRYLPARSAAVDSGDMIFLDRRQDVADTAELQRLLLAERQARADARNRLLSTALQIISTAGTALTVYLTLR